ncbi:restriction endonuclease subunit S [Vibrio alginolyticus]|nr:restriction endonuclease subunit S [Vibrio alginolyticus]
MNFDLVTYELGELGSLKNGANFNKNDAGDGCPVMSVKQLFRGRFVDTEGLGSIKLGTLKKLDDYLVKKNDLLFARSSLKAEGSGQVAIVNEYPQNCIFSGFTIRFRVFDESKVNPLYLYYLLRSPKYREIFVRITTGSVISNLTQATLSKIPVELPNKETQDYVANIFDELDRKRELGAATNQTLEQLAQAIFKSWFVDFDPVKAKMNGEQPEGMDAATASLFPEKLVESELGLIPEGWDVGTLSDVAKYCSARTKTDSITLENYISTENMLAEKKGVTAASKLPTAKTVAAYKSGDILVSNIRPYFKKIWLAEGSGGRSNDVLGFESVSANTESYLMNVLYQDTFFEYMTRTSKGAKMPRGDKTAIMNWEMAVPPVELREAFSAIVDKFYQLIPQNRAQNATLESLRDTLLPKLLSGELSLTDSLEVTNV